MAEPEDHRNLREKFKDKFGVDPVDFPPPIYNSVKSVGGNRNAVGCHNQVNRGEGHDFEYAKHKFPALGEANFYMKDTTTEGDVPVDKLVCIAKYQSHMKLVKAD